LDNLSTSGKQALNEVIIISCILSNKPVYKAHAGAGLDKKKRRGDLYFHITEKFVAGGIYEPKK